MKRWRKRAGSPTMPSNKCSNQSAVGCSCGEITRAPTHGEIDDFRHDHLGWDRHQRRWNIRNAGRPASFGGRITAVTDLSDAAPNTARVIDASGLVVSPGFIDIHAHSDVTLIDHPGAESNAYQGVTTEVTGNCGFSPFLSPPERASAQPSRHARCCVRERSRTSSFSIWQRSATG